jgi:hypothetical protein
MAELLVTLLSMATSTLIVLFSAMLKTFGFFFSDKKNCEGKY